MTTKNYTVFVGGGEVNDYYLNKRQAELLANEYKNDGYDDVAIMEINNSCEQCGNAVDLLAQFTTTGVCGKCARRNHKKSMGRSRMMEEVIQPDEFDGNGVYGNDNDWDD